MTHERLSITSCIWFEYQSRLLFRLLSSRACLSCVAPSPPTSSSFLT